MTPLTFLTFLTIFTLFSLSSTLALPAHAPVKRARTWQCKARNSATAAPPAEAVLAVQISSDPVSSAPAVSPTSVYSAPSDVVSINTNTIVSSTANNNGNGNGNGNSHGSGPDVNGSEDWLNSGIYSGGWTPPYVAVSSLSTVDLASVLTGVFAPCAPYVDSFYAIAAQLGIPPIILASIAMQESTCNPAAIGGAGEVGLMQITPEKCAGVANCADPYTNINIGGAFLMSQIQAVNGNFVEAIGKYNGWFAGITYDQMVSRKYSACHTMNNVDYLAQMMNGWLRGIDGHTLGTVRNLDSCKR